MTDTIAGNAEVVKVQTLADNGIRLTIDLPETAIFQAAALMELKRNGIAFGYEFNPISSNEDAWSDVPDA